MRFSITVTLYLLVSCTCGQASSLSAKRSLAIDSTQYVVDDLSAMLVGTCAVRRSDSQLYCWGTQGDIEGGWSPASSTQDTPQRVEVAIDSAGNSLPIAAVSGVATLGGHNCVIVRAHRGLRCWGTNDDGQVGLGGPSSPVELPVFTDIMTGVTDFAVGTFHTCALKNGNVFCWGRNEDFQCGRDVVGPITTVPTTLAEATLVGGVTKLVCISASCCAIKSGDVFCWGWNANGVAQVQDGPTPAAPNVRTPTRIPLPKSVALGLTVVDIAVSEAHACAVMQFSGVAYCWGRDFNGQLGAGIVGDDGPFPPQRVKFPRRRYAAKVAVTTKATCFILTNGEIACAGSTDDLPPLGLDTGTNVPLVFRTSRSVRARDIVGGGGHFCVRNGNRFVVCWGRNVESQLGGSDYPADATTPITYVKFE
jgi:alpha-tubulin suppressor-like RCC1 family protein